LHKAGDYLNVMFSCIFVSDKVYETQLINSNFANQIIRIKQGNTLEAMKELDYKDRIDSSQHDFLEAEKSHDQLFYYLESSMDLFPSEAFTFYRIFRPRLLLQLHQYRLQDLLSSNEIIRDEASKLSSELSLLHKDFKIEFSRSDVKVPYQLEQTFLNVVDPETAYFIQKHCHYLLNERKGLVHLGLFTSENNLIALATFSKNDLSHLDDVLPLSVNRDSCIVLSRLIIFEMAPSNTATFFLAKTKKWISENMPEVKIILTYLDPNLGFNGTVYKAFNAKLLVQEVKKRYLYENGIYVTDREMINKYGTSDIHKLKNFNTGRIIKESIVPLLPLKVFYWPVLNSIKEILSVQNRHFFSQPSNLTSDSNGFNFYKH